jgi:hypothetical protein
LSKTNGFGKRFFDKERRVVKFEFESKKNYSKEDGIQIRVLARTALHLTSGTTTGRCTIELAVFHTSGLAVAGRAGRDFDMPTQLTLLAKQLLSYE